MASLTLDGINKRFGHVRALDNVCLDVEDGSFCVLLGPSGCGKSTLLQIVAGLIKQDTGAVLLDGKPVDGLEPRERDVAMVFQNYALYPHMTVAQNLNFGLRMRGMSKEDAQKKVRETAHLLEIDGLLARKPRQLSGGQRQRVAMGRALVRHPRLFLLDEPLSNLDAQLRINVRLELKKLHERMKTTILYVTHDQVEAMTLGDQVVVIKEGRVHQIGVPENIYNHPVDTFVATFVGSPVMNLFEGELIASGDHLQFFCNDFSLDLENVDHSLIGKKVEAGIRPEDVELTTAAHGDMEAKVELVSNVGAEKFIHANVGESLITARASKKTDYRAGQILSLMVDPSKLHLFYEGQRI